MRITQKNIAKDLGVSFMTVSRVFNNSGYVSPELRRRILDYATEKGYKPHRASQVLVRNTVRNLAVFSSATPEYFWNDVGKGVLQAAEHVMFFNYEVRYHRIPDFDTERYCSLLSREIKNGLDAAAFVCQDIYDMDRIIAIAERANVPYILYNVDAPHTGRLCYIGSNYGAGGRLAANFIGKALGLKQNGRVLAIGFTRRDSRFSAMQNINSQRLDGFLSVMNGHFPDVSCTVEYVDCAPANESSTDASSADSIRAEAERQIMDILERHGDKTDAVYFIPAFNDSYHRALERFGRRGLITLQHDIDDSAVECLNSGLLTAVVFQDPVLQGYTVVRTMESILESKNTGRGKDTEIAHNLVFRENIDFLGNHRLMPESTEG